MKTSIFFVSVRAQIELLNERLEPAAVKKEKDAVDFLDPSKYFKKTEKRNRKFH